MHNYIINVWMTKVLIGEKISISLAEEFQINYVDNMLPSKKVECSSLFLKYGLHIVTMGTSTFYGRKLTNTNSVG